MKDCSLELVGANEYEPQVPGLHVTECARAQSDVNDVRVHNLHSTERECVCVYVWLSGSSLGTTEWQHQVAAECNGAYGWRNIDLVIYYCFSEAFRI